MIARSNPYFSGRIEILGAPDPYSLSGASVFHAAAAIVLLFEGRFAGFLQLDRDRGMIIVPRFAESGETGLRRWWEKARRELRPPSELSFFEWADQEKRGIADALESMTLDAPGRVAEGVNFVEEAKQLAREFREAIEKDTKG